MAQRGALANRSAGPVAKNAELQNLESEGMDLGLVGFSNDELEELLARDHELGPPRNRTMVRRRKLRSIQLPSLATCGRSVLAGWSAGTAAISRS
jgi:hypothetical protein